MSSPLQTTFAYQLEALAQHMRQNWAWPSPSSGFALHVFQAANAPLPFEAGSLTLLDVDKIRLDQAPVLASVGYSMTLPITTCNEDLFRAWACGLERVSARAAFPLDRQSFGYRPVELLGIVLGTLSCPYVGNATKDWLRRVLTEAESKLAGSNTWGVLLSACAANLYKVSWRVITPSPLSESTAQELALICWLGAAHPEFAGTANLPLRNAATELRERCATSPLSTPDFSEVALLHFALRQSVLNLLADVYAAKGTMLPVMQTTPTQEDKPLKVFISYSHDQDAWKKIGKDPDTHRKRVLALAQQLRGDGLECTIDQLVPNPPDGWPRWMMDQVEQADFVLVVATETYNLRFRGHEDKNKGFGAQWEGGVITQFLYNANGSNTKYVPIVFDHNDTEHIPLPLASATYYDLSSQQGYDELYFYLTDQPENIPAPLGIVRKRPPKTS